MDNRSFMILGHNRPSGFVWYDEIQRRDVITPGEVVYLAGRAMLIKAWPHSNSDVTEQYMDVEMIKFDEAYAEYLEVDETYEAMREATRQ